ncbi:MAG: HEAT repeat domain-containing protein [Planctomycetota bacterium]
MRSIKTFIFIGMCLAGVMMSFVWAHEGATPKPKAETEAEKQEKANKARKDEFDKWQKEQGKKESTEEKKGPPDKPEVGGGPPAKESEPQDDGPDLGGSGSEESSASQIGEDYILYDTVYNLIPLMDKKGSVSIDTISGQTKRRLTVDVPSIDFVYSYIIPFDMFLMVGWDELSSSAPGADKVEEFKPDLNIYFRRLLMTNFIKLTQMSPLFTDNYPAAQLSEYLIEIGQPSLLITQTLRKYLAYLASKKPPKKGTAIPGQIVAECVEKAIDVPALQPASRALTATDYFVTMINRLIVEELSKDYYYQSNTSFARRLRTLGEPIIPSLIEAAKNNGHSLIRHNAVSLLSFYDTPDIRPALRELLKSPDKVTRNRALIALINKEDIDIVPFLIETLKTGNDPYFKTFAAYALGQLKDKRAVKPLLDYINSEPNNTDILWAALPALGKIGDNSESVIQTLKRIVDLKRAPTKTWALLSLVALGDQAAADRLKLGPSNKDPFLRIDPATRYFALKVFSAQGEAGVSVLLDMVRNRSFDTRLRLAAMCHIKKFTKEHMTQLKAFLEDENMPAIIKAYTLYAMFGPTDPSICPSAEKVIKKALSGLNKENIRLDGEGLEAVVAMQILGQFKRNTVPVLKDIIMAEYNRSLKINAPQKDIEFLVPVAPVLETAVQELGKMQTKESSQELVNLLGLKNFPCRAAAAEALSQFKDAPAIDALIGVLSDEDGWTRYCAYRSLNKLTANDFNCEWCFATPEERQPIVKKWEKWWKEEQDKQKAK